MRYTVEHGKNDATPVEVRPLGPGRYWVKVGDGEAKVVDATLDAEGVHLLDGERSRYVRLGAEGKRAWSGGFGANVSVLSAHAARLRARKGAASVGGGDTDVLSPMPGRVVKLLVAIGDTVVPGQGVVIVEAMKMENELRAEIAGTVHSVHCAAGDTVEGGAKLLELAPTPE